MRRYRNHNNNFAGHDPDMLPIPTPSRLEPKDERLVEQAEDIGWQKGQNDLLAEDNSRLEIENAELRESNKVLQERNTLLERQDSEVVAESNSVSRFIDAVQQELKNRKEKK